MEREIENLKGAIALGQQTLKSLLLVNGASAIAVLTFYGHVHDDWEGKAGPLAWALVAFGVGVFMALLSSMLAYLSQLDVATTDEPKWEVPLRRSAVCSAVLSAVGFLFGLYAGASAFSLGFGA